MSTVILMIHDAHTQVCEVVFRFIEFDREMARSLGTRLFNRVQVTNWSNTITFSSCQDIETVKKAIQLLTLGVPYSVVEKGGVSWLND